MGSRLFKRQPGSRRVAYLAKKRRFGGRWQAALTQRQQRSGIDEVGAAVAQPHPGSAVVRAGAQLGSGRGGGFRLGARRLGYGGGAVWEAIRPWTASADHRSLS